MRLIDADELLRKLKKRQKYLKEDGDIGLIYLPVQAILESEHISEVVEKMAQRGIEPVKHGYWVARGGWYCSVCGKKCNDVDDPFEVALTDYCGCCGAKMDEVRDSAL